MQNEPGRLDKFFRPNVVAVVGASARQQTRGNIVIRNLQQWKFPGRIIPVHPSAAEIEGLATVRSIDDLPSQTDVAFLSVAAEGLATAIDQLDHAGVGAAVAIAAGFSSAEETQLRDTARRSRTLMHGPNCMGLINVSDGVPLYTVAISQKVKRGNVALLAQSGSAGVAVLNSLNAGFSKIVTLGSEYRVTVSEYLEWLATDPETSVIGLILESIRSPDAFAGAAQAAQRAGKRIVVLKAGRSAAGALATQAHTGAMVTPNDAYDCFFRDLGIPAVADYDEFTATLECLALIKSQPTSGRVALIGISGGETALACDVADEAGITLAKWSPSTAETVKENLSEAYGNNPLDLWATVSSSPETDFAAVNAIAQDPAVDTIVFVQDAQASLPDQLVGRYRPTVDLIAKLRSHTQKPMLVISPTGEATHHALTLPLQEQGVPVLRGLRPGLVASKNIAVAAAGARTRSAARAKHEKFGELSALVRGHKGLLPFEVCQRLLKAYDIPIVSSQMVRSLDDPALARVTNFPVVAKVSSPDIAHRSDVGGVRTGIRNASELADAIASIREAIRLARPDATIDGFEIQIDLTGCVEVMVGFTAVPPLGALTVVGSGGVLTELQGNRAVGLGVLAPEAARDMIGKTTPGKMLAGYRRLLPETKLEPLADLICNLSRMAADFEGLLTECDLNPVMVRPGSGDAFAVDVLLVANQQPG